MEPASNLNAAAWNHRILTRIKRAAGVVRVPRQLIAVPLLITVAASLCEAFCCRIGELLNEK